MDAKAQLRAIVDRWEAERGKLKAIIEDPTTTPEIRVRSIVTLAKMVVQIEALVIELKDSGDTIH